MFVVTPGDATKVIIDVEELLGIMCIVNLAAQLQFIQ
jgi:hypothetical protein